MNSMYDVSDESVVA